MFRNVYYDYRGSKINLWETINGERMFTKIDWVPYIYVPDERGDIKSIDDVKVRKLEFDSYAKFNVFNDDKNIKKYEDHVKPELQFLSERYHQFADDSLVKPLLRIGTLDIEVHKEHGFPKPEDADGTVTAITLDINDTAITFGIKPYTGKHHKRYVYCKTEEILLSRFFDYMNAEADIDILTGWNIDGFDIPYLYYRCIKLFGENNKIFRKISPINETNVWDKKDGTGLNFDIAGISIIDYLAIYKRFTRSNPESFKLDVVSFNELGENKLEYEGTLQELFNNDWEKYVDYNVWDTKLIWKLEGKLKYINLIQTVSLLSRCPMKYFDKVTNVLEGIFLTYYRRNNLCAPKLKGGKSEWFEAAFVKEPHRGIHEWVVDFDVTSMYPFIMITLNMSPETYVGCIVSLKEDEVVKYVREREFPEFSLESENREYKTVSGKELKNFNTLLKRGLFSIAPNGAIFKNTKAGVVPIIEKTFFKMRKDTKDMMLQLKKEDGDPLRIAELKTTEQGIKVGVLNSLYGALSTPYFRLYNIRIAEAITSCGRHILKNTIIKINEYLNNESNITEDFNDYVLYCDTDSTFVGLGKFIQYNKNLKDKFDSLVSTKDKASFILSICKNVENLINDYSYNEIQVKDFSSQEKEYKINWKQEIIASSILLVEKKKYGCWIINEEGKDVDKVKVTGLDIIRSEISKPVKVILKDIMTMVLKNEKDDIVRERIIQYRKDMKNLPIEDLSTNKTINNINKYIHEDGPIKGCPQQVKGVYTHDFLIKKFGLEDKYQEVYEGDKAKVIYLKPNAYGFDCITYSSKYPKEIKGIQPDIEKMIEKYFDKKIKMLLEPANKMYLLDANSAVLDFFF